MSGRRERAVGLEELRWSKGAESAEVARGHGNARLTIVCVACDGASSRAVMMSRVGLLEINIREGVEDGKGKAGPNEGKDGLWQIFNAQPQNNDDGWRKTRCGGAAG